MISFFATPLGNFGLASVAYLLGAAAGGYATVQGLLLSRSTRLRKTTPVAKLGKTSLGPVEASGIAAGPYTVIAPITGMACFGYRTVAWRLKTAGNGHPDEIVAEEKLYVPFYLDDGTGKLLIDPTGAKLDLRQDFRHEFRDAARANDNPSLQNVREFLARQGVLDCANLRVEEFCIKPKYFLFIRGVLAKNPGLGVAPRPQTDTRPPAPKTVIRTLSAFAAELPVPPVQKDDRAEEWMKVPPSPDRVMDLISTLTVADSSTQLTQQGKIAAALERAGIVMPDIRSLLRERDGGSEAPHGNPDAEEIANAVADENGQNAADGNETNGEFDLKPPVVLMKDRNSSYVISWRDPGKAVPLPRNATLMLWGGPLITMLCLSLLASQLGLL